MILIIPSSWLAECTQRIGGELTRGGERGLSRLRLADPIQRGGTHSAIEFAKIGKRAANVAIGRGDFDSRQHGRTIVARSRAHGADPYELAGIGLQSRDKSARRLCVGYLLHCRNKGAKLLGESCRGWNAGGRKWRERCHRLVVGAKGFGPVEFVANGRPLATAYAQYRRDEVSRAGLSLVDVLTACSRADNRFCTVSTSAGDRPADEFLVRSRRLSLSSCKVFSDAVSRVATSSLRLLSVVSAIPSDRMALSRAARRSETAGSACGSCRSRVCFSKATTCGLEPGGRGISDGHHAGKPERGQNDRYGGRTDKSAGERRRIQQT